MLYGCSMDIDCIRWHVDRKCFPKLLYIVLEAMIASDVTESLRLSVHICIGMNDEDSSRNCERFLGTPIVDSVLVFPPSKATTKILGSTRNVGSSRPLETIISHKDCRKLVGFGPAKLLHYACFIRTMYFLPVQGSLLVVLMSEFRLYFIHHLR